MYKQPSYQVAYANFVMVQDQHQDTPTTPQNTSPLLQNNSVLQPQQSNIMELNKPVRTRISYTHSQQVQLEREFQGSAYIYRSRRVEIAARLGIEEKHVKVWFQNRRMKWKRETLQKGNKVTLKKSTQFAVPAELRKVPVENARKEIPLPVHKPVAAELVKGVCLNVPKVFRPQLIVQMPVPVTVPRSTKPSNTRDHLRQPPTQQQQQPESHRQPLPHQVHQVLQQALDVQHKLQRHQPPQQPMLEVPHFNAAPFTIIPKDTIIDGLKNPECSEESVDLDRYLNHLERRVKALKEEEHNQQQDLGDCIEKIDSLSNCDMAALSPKIDDDFDINDLLDDLDRYVSNPGPATELDFDDSLFTQDVDFDNCPILEYDPTLPLVDFSFDDWTLVGH